MRRSTSINCAAPALVALALVACGSGTHGDAGTNPGGGARDGGASGAAGAGGASNGGASNGGASNGGASNGGASNGGASNGGASNGGASNGGASNGGASNGGASSDGGPSGHGLAGPLTVSSNGRYFEDATGHAVLLAGSHTWNNLQDWGSNGTPEAFDFDAYVRFLVAHGHDFTLLWRTELPKFCGLPTTDSNAPDFTTSGQPWPRTGPGTADDGGPEFDLTKFDTAYFDRLRSRVSALNAAGIWVGVYLFTGEWLNVYRCSGDGHPLTGGNNVNSIDDGGGNGSMDMSAENALTAVEDAMVNHTIDTLNDLPNVLWIVSEEAAASTEWWQGHMIAHVRSYESKKPMQHPIGLAAITGAPDSNVYDSDADWVAPFAKISPESTCGAGTPKCKVNLNDSDHSYFGMWNDSAQANRNYAWENFLRGNQVAFMDPYAVYYPRQSRNLCASPHNGICSTPDARWDGFRDTLGYIVSYSQKLDLNAAAPNDAWCSTTYCLGEKPQGGAGTEILVYAPDGGSFTVDLANASGRTLDYEWFDPSSGKVAGKGSIAGGNAAEPFTTPAAIAGDSVLYLVDSKGHG